ncbi:MAG TPA: phage holin family protein [Burkholderiales bacterium]|nr:phage holin family protein [Burkholderiales bacterium]
MSESDPGTRTAGLLDSLRRLLSTLIEVVQTRVELLVTELEEQKLRAVQLATLFILASFFFGLAIIFGTLAVVMVYWDRNPVAVLSGFAALYLALAIIIGLIWRARAKARPHFLSATLTELSRDREGLTPP